MKEYIERAAVKNLLDRYGATDDALALIDTIPAAEVAEVVRCRECDNHSEVDGLHYCKFWRMYCPNDSEFFCKAGQRKEDTHEVSE